MPSDESEDLPEGEISESLRTAILVAAAASDGFWDDGVERGYFNDARHTAGDVIGAIDACAELDASLKAHLIERAQLALSISRQYGEFTQYERGALPSHLLARIRVDLKRAARGVPAATIIERYTLPERLIPPSPRRWSDLWRSGFWKTERFWVWVIGLLCPPLIALFLFWYHTP